MLNYEVCTSTAVWLKRPRRLRSVTISSFLHAFWSAVEDSCFSLKAAKSSLPRFYDRHEMHPPVIPRLCAVYQPVSNALSVIFDV